MWSWHSSNGESVERSSAISAVNEPPIDVAKCVVIPDFFAQKLWTSGEMPYLIRLVKLLHMSLEEKYTYRFRIQAVRTPEVGDEQEKAEVQSLVFDILGIIKTEREKTDTSLV